MQCMSSPSETSSRVPLDLPPDSDLDLSCTSSPRHAASARSTLSPSSSTTYPLGLSTHSAEARGPSVHLLSLPSLPLSL
jgi:hypothetical protein